MEEDEEAARIKGTRNTLARSRHIAQVAHFMHWRGAPKYCTVMSDQHSQAPGYCSAVTHIQGAPAQQWDHGPMDTGSVSIAVQYASRLWPNLTRRRTTTLRRSPAMERGRKDVGDKTQHGMNATTVAWKM